MITLTDNEKILIKIRKHWLIMTRNAIVLGAIVIAPIIVYMLAFIFPFPNLIHVPGESAFLWGFLAALWVLFFWIILFIAWTDYYLDIMIITNERIFDVDQVGLFNRQSSTFRLDRIQDVTVEVKGILPTLFRFGHIHIQTAGEKREFIAQYIPKPYDVKELIMREHDAAMEKMQRAI